MDKTFLFDSCTILELTVCKLVSLKLSFYYYYLVLRRKYAGGNLEQTVPFT
jgi:uncharacterized membrane protein